MRPDSLGDVVANRRRRLLPLLVAGFLAVHLLGMGVGRASAKIQKGNEGIAFTGTNFLTNQPLDLSQDLGKKVILLDFGSIYCSSCMVTVPNLIKLSKEYSQDQLGIYNIYLDIYNPQRVIKFFKGFAKDLKFSLLIDNKLAISRAYGVDTLPTTVLIDKNGVVRSVIVGYTEADEKEITRLIGDLVRELPSAGQAGQASGTQEEFLVFTPESFTKTTSESVHVVGYVGGGGVKDVSYRLNNLPESVAQTKKNVFHFKTKLSLAMNLIEISSQVQEGKQKSESVVVFREPKMGMAISSELPQYKFHMDDEKKSCVECHKLGLSAQERESQQSTQICLECHRELTNQIYVHGPISVGGCLPCHDYASFPVKYELRGRGAELCLVCHEKMVGKLKEPNLHGPVAARVCSVCHEPHGSSERFLLRKRVDQMCISCHQDILRDYAKGFIHTPVREGDCTGCHDPHASDYAWFLRGDHQTFCGLCHEPGTYTHTHRVGSLPSKEIPAGKDTPPLDAEGRTICATCHYVHSSDYGKLARGTVEGYCSTICH